MAFDTGAIVGTNVLVKHFGLKDHTIAKDHWLAGLAGGKARQGDVAPALYGVVVADVGYVPATPIDRQDGNGNGRGRGRRSCVGGRR